MADRLLVDLDGDGGRVAVGMWVDGELPAAGQPCELTWPLDHEALEDLRWYLEDYLRAPFGVWEDRGPQIEAALPRWGHAMFSAVFGAGPAREAYIGVRARQRPVEVVFRSASPSLLGLPWELMADPGRPTPLALEMAGVSRSLPVTEAAETIAVPGERLRVLMVISRPAGTGDVGYRMIARPLLERLEAVRGKVDLVVLRPPTLDALQDALAGAAQAGEPFQIVHFDGHGALTGRQMAPTGRGPEGALVFERPGGGPERVPPSRVAQVLAAGRVPVVVLNACQSGAVGKDLEAAVATRLLQAGVASVVAMAYSVYAVAAAEFMAAFYEQLFAGSTVTAAVTAGRQRLYQRNLRPSPKGELPLADWVVPVHYLCRDVSFPQARTERAQDLPSLDEVLDTQRAASATGAGAGDLDAVGSFVGRDDLFFQLEGAARLQKVVVLHGPGGTGKTELAKAFGRWWHDTGGVEQPDGVFWHSFEPGTASFGLDGVITQIGLQLFGSDFAQLASQERRAVLQTVLAERQMLLIWDNFETVRSMPDPGGATKPLDEAGCAELREFLHYLSAHGHGAVLITSRTPEDWLGGVGRIAVGGLAAHEAAEFAGDLLAPCLSVGPRRARRAFGELMEWLDGHPLSMRLILPRLEAAEPEALLAGLQGAATLPGGQDGQGRTTSLSVCVSYSFAHLGEAVRRLLPAVCLVQAVADVDVLNTFSQAPGVPGRFAGATRQDWERALEDAARVGLLTGLSGGRYRIHPALPGYLAAWWRRQDPDDHDAAREAATKALVTAHAILGGSLYRQIISGDAGLAYTVIGLERRTLGSLLGYALDHGLWAEAELIIEPLQEYWSSRGLDEEAAAWADRARRATEDPGGTPPQPDTLAGWLWLFVTSSQARRELERHHLDEAERTYRQILTMLQAQPVSSQQQQHLATACHQLGMVAQNRGRLDDAEDWYRKALAIRADISDKPGLAMTYHQLGIAAHSRGRLDDALSWYIKSLAIEEELGNKLGMAGSYHQLGNLAGDRGWLDDAEGWYCKALAIEEELCHKPGMALACNALGAVAQERWLLDDTKERLLDDAEEWYRKALAIREELGDKPGTADTYHQLGVAAHSRGRLDDAEGWYRKALAIDEEIGNTSGMAGTFGQLGLLAEERGQPRQALEWTVRSVALFREFPHPATGPAPGHLARLTAQLGTDALKQCWQQVTGSSLPPTIRSYVEPSQAHHHRWKGRRHDR